jgi:phosphoribosylaminoimidazole carboxylase PurE protein
MTFSVIRAIRGKGFGIVLAEAYVSSINPKVAIVVGSDSDLPVLQDALRLLTEFGIPHEITLSSAHRSPDKTLRYAVALEGRGIQVVIACAGAAAHLAGVIAAHTILPVIGVPVDSSPLKGFDALLSTSMMPAGVPVATMGIGQAGATNAAILAAQILARGDSSLAQRLKEYRQKLSEKIEERDRELKKTQT